MFISGPNVEQGDMRKETPAGPSSLTYPLHCLFGKDSGEIPVEPLLGRLAVNFFSWPRTLRKRPAALWLSVSRLKCRLASGSVAA